MTQGYILYSEASSCAVLDGATHRPDTAGVSEYPFISYPKYLYGGRCGRGHHFRTYFTFCT